MNSLSYFITKTYHAALDLSILAQTQWKSTEDLKEGIGKIAGIIIAISFLVALISYFVGAATKTTNPAASKAAFYIVWTFAIGGPVVSLIFYIFAGADSVSQPSFK
jgi:hypothetical protein